MLAEFSSYILKYTSGGGGLLYFIQHSVIIYIPVLNTEKRNIISTEHISLSILNNKDKINIAEVLKQFRFLAHLKC